MTELFCKIANRTRVLLYVLLGASVIRAALDITGILSAYNTVEESGAFPVGPVLRTVLCGPAVYGLILAGVRLGGERLVVRFMLMAAFGMRAVLLLAESAGGDTGEMVVLLRDITNVLAASSACIVLGINRFSYNLKRMVSLMSMAAMVGALTTAYLAAVGTLDGEIDVVRGILTAPEALLGIILALFFGDIRQRETEGES